MLPEPTFVALPRINGLKLSIHLFKKKKKKASAIPIHISVKLGNALATDITAAELLGFRLSLFEVI